MDVVGDGIDKVLQEASSSLDVRGLVQLREGKGVSGLPCLAGIVGKQGIPYVSTQEPAIPNELLDQLLAGGAASAVFEQGGPLDALTERALNAEMDHHLAGDDGTGNTRNGYGRKTVTTESGKLEIDIPRDRQSRFDPQLIAKYQWRFPGSGGKIVSMYARGMSTREIAGAADLCGNRIDRFPFRSILAPVLQNHSSFGGRTPDEIYAMAEITELLAA